MPGVPVVAEPSGNGDGDASRHRQPLDPIFGYDESPASVEAGREAQMRQRGNSIPCQLLIRSIVDSAFYLCVAAGGQVHRF